MITYLLLSAGLLPWMGCGQAPIDDNAAFDYREIYLPESSTREARELHLNNVDDDWGIWGHNLRVVVPDDPSLSIYAYADGQTDTEQFCFSSDQLYKYIERYIADNFSESRTTRFSIMPQDNSVACLCEQCISKGCTFGNAAPAVFSMIERLCHRFPNHLFFTSYYLTTRSLPQQPLPPNAGVLFSTIDYPLCARPTEQEEETRTLLSKWGKMTQQMYVWDYINNFDDYFTPFPVFTIMQRRFRLYRDTGVRGIFLNGSGTDYSTFSRLRTHVLAALMRNPDEDWRTLLRERCHEFYPTCGNVIADFIVQQEDLVAANGKELPLYEGVARSLKSYLDEAALTTFFDELQRLLPETGDDEHDEISHMLQALSLTKLELMRIAGAPAGCAPLLQQLSELPAHGVRIYSETFWSVDDYVHEYTSMWKDYEATRKKNLLLHAELTALTRLDEGYTDLSILTDGLPGLPSNYHCGHLISSASPHLRLAIPRLPGLRHLRVGLTSNQRFHIALPQEVVLTSGDRELGRVHPQPHTGLAERVVEEFDIPADATGTLILTLVRNPDVRTMALDEVQAF